MGMDFVSGVRARGLWILGLEQLVKGGATC